MVRNLAQNTKRIPCLRQTFCFSLILSHQTASLRANSCLSTQRIRTFYGTWTTVSSFPDICWQNVYIRSLSLDRFWVLHREASSSYRPIMLVVTPSKCMTFQVLSWFYLDLPIIPPLDSTLFVLHRNASLINLKKHMVSYTCFVFRRSFRLSVLTERFSDFPHSLTVSILIRVLL